jgi:hypothetical protein
MFLQHGGLKIKTPTKRGFDPVRDMINSPGASVEMLTCGSLKGFMFVLNVRPEHSEYLALAGSRFTKPVTSFILKLAITTRSEENLVDYIDIAKPENHPDRMIEKATETRDGFFEEAKLQQSIWKSSITGGRDETCPSVANLSFFDNADAMKFLDFMRYKVHNPESIHTIAYLYEVCQVNAGHGLGLILMPKVENSDTFQSFKNIPQGERFHGITITDAVVYNMYAKILAKIIRLYIESGVIHFDLHGKNALIYVTPNKELNAVIIDFGRASNLNSGVSDDYFRVSEKITMLDAVNKQPSSRKTSRGSAATNGDGGYRETCLSMCGTANDASKTSFVKDVISKIVEKDHEKNQKIFGNPRTYQHGSYQMSWMEKLIPTYTQMLTRHDDERAASTFEYIAPLAFNFLCDLLSPVGREGSLSKHFLDESCVNFEGKSAAIFVVPFKTTWTEWAKSFRPYLYRGIKSITRRSKGGRKIKARATTTKRKYKQSKNRKSKNRK